MVYMMNEPTLGTTEAVVRRRAGNTSTPYAVQVREYKFDSIRQESYWVTVQVKTFKKKADAMIYAGRFGSITYLDVV